MKKLLKITLTVFFTTILLLGFAVPVNMVGNWYQQFLPSIGNRSIQDIFFLDSLTGWAVTNKSTTDTMYVLKTTNAGDNWVIQYRKIQTGGGFSGYFKVYFLNQNTGYTSDVLGIYKTINGGNNWTSLNAPVTAYLDMSVLNNDTIWIVTPDSFSGGVFRTTNGGTNWDQQLNIGSLNPTNIYFYDKDTGFAAENVLYKTTNSGVNWTQLPSGGGFSDMFFVNALTGWKASGFIKKTTDGGLNWSNQPIPEGGNILGNGAIRFMNKDEDTIWAVGETLITGGNPLTRGILFRTTNGGAVWQYQLPDTAIHINRYLFGQIINNKTGWAYSFNPTGIHTTTGGDPVWITGITQISTQVPKEYQLFQNYPNPFNPKTNIKYQITNNRTNVQLRIFDVTGREIITLVNAEQQAGTYEVDFLGNNYSSGIYFYSLIIDGSVIQTKKMILIK